MVRTNWLAEPLVVDRCEEAAAVYRAYFPEPWERPWSREEFSALLGSPGCFGLLLVDAGKPPARGLILLRVAADEAEILTIGVVPEGRGRHGADFLLGQAIVDSAARGASRMFLEVADDNRSALRLYGRHGFKVVAQRRSYYGRGTAEPASALVMRRDLMPTSKAFTDA